jgi:hypothetical protein
MELRPGYRGATRDISARSTGAPAPTDSKDSIATSARRGRSNGPPALVLPTSVFSWRERESATQARSRDDNESTASTCAGAPGEGLMGSFRCECGDEGCTEVIRLTLAEYESVRACPTRFAVARNHENPESELVVDEHERFAVVETVTGESVKLARRSYSRHSQSTRR